MNGYRMVYQRLDSRGKVVFTEDVVVKDIVLGVGSLVPYSTIEELIQVSH